MGRSIAFDETGKRLAVCYPNDRAVEVLFTDLQREARLVHQVHKGAICVLFRPFSAGALAACGPAGAMVWRRASPGTVSAPERLEGGPSWRSFVATSKPCADASWSPCGRRLALALDEGAGGVLVVEAASRASTLIRAGPERFGLVYWGTKLYAAEAGGGKMRAWEPPSWRAGGWDVPASVAWMGESPMEGEALILAAGRLFALGPDGQALPVGEATDKPMGVASGGGRLFIVGARVDESSCFAFRSGPAFDRVPMQEGMGELAGATSLAVRPDGGAAAVRHGDECPPRLVPLA